MDSVFTAVEVVVRHDGATLDLQGGFVRVREEFLGLFVRRGLHPLRLLSAGDPHLVDFAARIRCIAVRRLLWGIDRGRLEVAGRELRCVAHVVLWLPLNCTGTEPTA